MEVGMGSGDSRMVIAAVEGRSGEADDDPRTITCRFVDLSAERRFDGGAVGHQHQRHRDVGSTYFYR